MEITREALSISDRAKNIPLPIFREIYALAQSVGAVNLAGGTPDFPPPDEVKFAAIEKIEADFNQYTFTHGTRGLREGIASRISHRYGVDFDPETEITVCCGSTEAMAASMLAVINPSDEVIIFEPFFPSYHADVIISGGKPVLVKLRAPQFRIDQQELEAVITPRTKAIFLNSPNNPTGRVFSEEETAVIASICLKYNLLVFVDEIYDNLIYDGLTAKNIWLLPGMKERSLIINGISKTYSATGWRVGYVIAPASITNGIRVMHNHLTLGAPTPLQMAAEKALTLPDAYYRQLAEQYQARRDFLADGLKKIGFECLHTQGGYFIVAGFEKFSQQDDYSFAKYLVNMVGVAVIPMSGFYADPGKDEKKLLRITFCKKEETLRSALDRLKKLASN